MSFGAALAWLWGEASALHRVDMMLDAAGAGGLDVVGIHLAPDDFDDFRRGCDTHLFSNLTALGGTHRGIEVRRVVGGRSWIEVRDPCGRRSLLEIGPPGQ